MIKTLYQTLNRLNLKTVVSKNLRFNIEICLFKVGLFLRYFSYENVTTDEDRSPRIEVCFKKTTLKVCPPNDIKVTKPANV